MKRKTTIIPINNFNQEGLCSSNTALLDFLVRPAGFEYRPRRDFADAQRA